MSYMGCYEYTKELCYKILDAMGSAGKPLEAPSYEVMSLVQVERSAPIFTMLEITIGSFYRNVIQHKQLLRYYKNPCTIKDLANLIWVGVTRGIDTNALRQAYLTSFSGGNRKNGNITYAFIDQLYKMCSFSDLPLIKPTSKFEAHYVWLILSFLKDIVPDYKPLQDVVTFDRYKSILEQCSKNYKLPSMTVATIIECAESIMPTGCRNSQGLFTEFLTRKPTGYENLEYIVMQEEEEEREAIQYYS